MDMLPLGFLGHVCLEGTGGEEVMLGAGSC